MDMEKIIRLVKKTKELIKNREMAAHVKEKGGSRLCNTGRYCSAEFLKKRIVSSCSGYSISR